MEIRRYRRITFWNEMVILFILISICMGIASADKIREHIMIDIDNNKWKVLHQLITENKLPILSKEEEEEILKEVDRILTEEKSLYTASLYLVKKVGNYDGGYLLYGNPRIKEKLVELMKMKIQCGLKRSIIEANKHIEEQIKDYSGEEKERKRLALIESCGTKKIEKRLEELVVKDGDMCPECYLYDKEEEEALKCLGDEEGKPGDYSWNVAVLYSVALSSLPTDMYEYLWAGKDSMYLCGMDYALEDIWMCKTTYILLATIYADKLIEEIENGQNRYGYIYLKEWRDIRVEELWDVIRVMKDINPEYLEKEKKRLKKMIYDFGKEKIKMYSIRRDHKFLGKAYEVLDKVPMAWLEDLDESIWITIIRDEIRLRENMLSLYESIGDREDIEDIKKIIDGIPRLEDYPLKYTEKDKERYYQEVKDLQDRVNALVEKLSHQ